MSMRAAIAAVAACVLLLSASAFAESRTARRVRDLNRAAMEDYDLLELDSAKKLLNDALALLKRGHLEKSRLAARTHMNVAIVYGAGLGDRDTALLEFVAALQIDPHVKLDPAYRSPALEKTFEQARTTVVGGTPGTGETVRPPPEPLLKHTPVDEAPAGEPIVISVRVSPDIADRVDQVILRYRPAGTEMFATANMRSAGEGEFQGAIPEQATGADSVQYFIEARAATGKVIATTGSLDAPHIISIAHAGGRMAGGGGDHENPLGRAGGETTTTAKKAPPAAHKTFYFGVSAGAGGGYITGETEVSHQGVTCCLAVAPFHIMPEVGFWLSRRLTLSAVGRIGFPFGANVSGAAKLAPAVLLRLRYVFGRRGGPYVHGDLGGGFIRHVVKLGGASAASAGGNTDTYATGPLLAGGGAGWIVPLGSALRFTIDLNVLAGIPVVKTIGSGSKAIKPGFAINGDLSLGISLAF